MIATIASVFFLRRWVWPDLNGWLLISGVVVFSFYGQLWMTTALRRAPPYLVTPFQYFHPVISFGLGWLLWKDAITPGMALGILLIILSGSLISFFETKIQTSQKIPTLPSETSL
jgi:drug/metabolite transporter (DMT)-like permease